MAQARDPAQRESGVDSILMVDRQGIIHGASGDTRGMLSRALGSLKGATLESVLDPLSAKRVYSRFDEVLKNGITAPALALTGLSALTEEGATIPVQAVLTSLETDEEDMPSLLVTLKTDSPATGRRERERRTRERLESSNRDLEAFASVAAHDLQEPLRKIRAFSDRIAHSLAQDDLEAVTRYLERIDSSASRMQALIDDLLNLARITGQEPRRETLDLTVLVGDIASETVSRAGEDASVDVGEIPPVSADPVRMHQLFENLIGNALKFRREHVPVHVAVVGEQEGEWVHVRVGDNGIGFDDRYLDKIFEPFERLHGRSEYEGSGVGLALCRAIVERHGGTLVAHGEPGVGATFEAVLPAADTP